ncbi:hypothetical protein [Embleya sp. NPDC050493]|uniref:hypothetical protein n=1 Tax=Embleya sp. NPDC050493 TaxID=3363989 RepID=UPI0037ADB386
MPGEEPAVRPGHADEGLTGRWDVDTVLEDLSRPCCAFGPRRRSVAPITGVDLLTAARAGIERAPPATTRIRPR